MDQKISDSSVAGETKTKTNSTIGEEIEEKEPIKAVEKIKKKKKAAAVGDNEQKKKAKNKKKKVILISAVSKDSTATTVVTSEGGAKGCRVQVSNTKKPLFFYLNVAKRYIKQNNFVELSALGMAIPTVVTISEMLKKDGWATEKKIGTSTVMLKDVTKGRVIMKAKIEILLERGKGAVDTKVATKGNEEVVKKAGSECDGTLTGKKEIESGSGKLAEEGKDENLNVQKASCGGITDQKNSEVAVAAAAGN